MRIGMTLYGAAALAAVPLVPLYLLWRARRQPEYLGHWNERFGPACPGPGGRTRILLHSVSVGETNAARPLVRELLARIPDSEVLLTHMTPTGRETGARIAAAHPGRVLQRFLPYDAPGLMSSFLKNARPSLVIVMETEVWPRMLACAKEMGIPTVLANARLSEKSFRQAMRAQPLMREAFGSFTAVLAQSDASAERLRAAGAADPQVVGSLKFDVRPDREKEGRGRSWRQALNRPVWLLASTRDGEEAMLLGALAARGKLAGDPLVLLVPRHPQRFDAVAELVKAKGFPMARRSRIAGPESVPADTRVLLGDSMGEMSMYCGMADVAFMGGSLGNFGCQNLVEPALAGAPVVVGPSTFNFAHIVEEALAEGACTQVADAAAAWDELERVAGTGLAERRARALGFARRHAGATERMCRAILPLVGVRP